MSMLSPGILQPKELATCARARHRKATCQRQTGRQSCKQTVCGDSSQLVSHQGYLVQLPGWILKPVNPTRTPTHQQNIGTLITTNVSQQKLSVTRHPCRERVYLKARPGDTGGLTGRQQQHAKSSNRRSHREGTGAGVYVWRRNDHKVRCSIKHSPWRFNRLFLS